jgi:predicted MFS family arabinose efflux permease
MITIKQPTARWVTIAGIMRTFAGISCATYLPIFFLKVYPTYKSTFAVTNALSLAIGGLVSSLLGGILSDHFENKNLMSKAYICMISSLMAFPLTALCCLNQKSFYFSMGAITCKTFMSAAFTSPAITMMQNTTSAKDQGNVISSHVFWTALAATVCPITFSWLSNYLGAAANPAIYGKVLTVFALIGYWGSVPFWWLAGRSYKKHMEE